MSAVLTRQAERTGQAAPAMGAGKAAARSRGNRRVADVRSRGRVTDPRARGRVADPRVQRRATVVGIRPAAAGCRVERPNRVSAAADAPVGLSDRALAVILGLFAALMIVGVFCVVSTAVQVTAEAPGLEGAPVAHASVVVAGVPG